MVTGGRARYAMYAFLVFLVAYFAFDFWRPSVLLVGNVTIDIIGNSANPKHLPGGTPFKCV
jgi:hypothetical protein